MRRRPVPARPGDGREGASSRTPATPAERGMMGAGSTARGTGWTILVLHHTHTDVGYTAPQHQVARWQGGFIRQALEATQANRLRQDRELNPFKWVCETFWGVEEFLQGATAGERERFAHAVRTGEIGLSSSYLNFNELLDFPVLRRVTARAVRYGTSIGAPVTCAMTADINGHGWGFARALCDLGVRNLLTCVHTHHGVHPLGRPQTPFWWEAPSGDRLLVWNGEHYHLGNELGIVPGAAASYLIKDDCDASMIFHDSWGVAERRIPRYLASLQAVGYPYRFVPVMASGLRSDNAPPNPAILEFIDRWNGEHGEITRLEMATLEDLFRLLREDSQEIPVHRGDWPDWWSDGLAGDPGPTRIFRQAQRNLELYRQLEPERSPRVEEAERTLALYAEHTFSHSESVSRPWASIVHEISGRKCAFAALALEQVGELLADLAAGPGAGSPTPDQPLAWSVRNPWPRPRRHLVPLSVGQYEYRERRLDEGATVHDLESGRELPAQVEVGPLEAVWWVETWLAPHEVRELGIAAGPGRPDETHDEIRIDGNGLRTPFVAITWRMPDGIVAWADPRDGRSLLRTDRRFAPFSPIHEETPVPQWREQCRVRGAMGLNRKGADVTRSVGRLTGARTLARGPLFAAVELEYEVTGASPFLVELRASAIQARVAVTVRLAKDNRWNPENLYLPLPFTSAREGEKEDLWLDKAGTAVRPGRDQIPGSLTDFSCVQGGLALTGPAFGVALATLDAPLVQLGPLEHGVRRLADPSMMRDESNSGSMPELHSWLMTNYWETNFSAGLGGFYEFRYLLCWDPTLADPANALDACRDQGHDFLIFRRGSLKERPRAARDHHAGQRGGDRSAGHENPGRDAPGGVAW